MFSGQPFGGVDGRNTALSVALPASLHRVEHGPPSGVDVKTVIVGGWRNMKVLQRYLHPTDDAKRWRRGRPGAVAKPSGRVCKEDHQHS